MNHKSYRLSDCQKCLAENGFEFVRHGKHFIYKRGDRHISLPRTVNVMMWKRLVKENNLSVNFRLHPQ